MRGRLLAACAVALAALVSSAVATATLRHAADTYATTLTPQVCLASGPSQCDLPADPTPHFCGGALRFGQHVVAEGTGQGVDVGSTSMTLAGASSSEGNDGGGSTVFSPPPLAPGTYPVHLAYSGGSKPVLKPNGDTVIFGYLPSSADETLTVGCPLALRQLQPGKDEPASRSPADGLSADVAVTFGDRWTNQVDGCDLPPDATYAFTSGGDLTQVRAVDPCRWRLTFARPKDAHFTVKLVATTHQGEAVHQTGRVVIDPCPHPVPVDVTSVETIHVTTADCLLVHAPWAAASSADLHADVASMHWVLAVDDEPRADATVVEHRSDGTLYGDFEALVWGLPAGTHSIAFAAVYSREAGSAIDEYPQIPADSLFVGGALLDVAGAGRALPTAPPCPPQARGDGSPYGPDGWPACIGWGSLSQPLQIRFDESLNPDSSLCERTIVSARASCNAESSVASIIAIDGPTWVRRANGRIERAYIQMPLYVGDAVVTDPSAIAAVEFAVGGKIGVNRGSLVRVTGNRVAVDANGNLLRLDAGTIWIKWGQWTERWRTRLIIRTRNSAIGIRG